MTICYDHSAYESIDNGSLSCDISRREKIIILKNLSRVALLYIYTYSTGMGYYNWKKKNTFSFSH